jgi:hypothetical protein
VNYITDLNKEKTSETLPLKYEAYIDVSDISDSEKYKTEIQSQIYIKERKKEKRK